VINQVRLVAVVWFSESSHNQSVVQDGFITIKANRNMSRVKRVKKAQWLRVNVVNP
ncbi:unnamed protein product, partial [Acidithrix sp. C25]